MTELYRSQETAAVTPLPLGIYTIHSAYSPTSALDLTGGLTSDGSAIRGQRADPNAANQKWIFELGARGYRIKNAASKTYLSYRLRELPHHMALSGNGNNPVEWQLFKSHLGYEIRLAFNPDLVVDLADWNAENNAEIWLVQRHGGANQHWVIEGLQTNYVSAVPAGQYIIRNVHTETALDLDGTADGTPVVGFAISRQSTQTWVLEPGSSGYRIKNIVSGTYISFRDHETPSKSLAVSCNARPVEWQITRGPKSYAIRLASQPNHVLDMYGANSANGTRVVLWDSHGGASQQWDFIVA